MPSLNPNCRLCGLWKSSQTVCVAGDGPKDARVVAIGEAPGANEAKTGRPFTGRSGQLLRSELALNGLSDKVYITNVVKCRPPENRTPTAAEIKACRPYLEKELAEIKPEFVVTLGAPATKAMFRGVAKITQHHGKLIPDKRGFTGMPSYHPAATLYDPTKTDTFKHDIARLGRAVRGQLREGKIPWNIVRRGNLAVFLREFAEAPRFSYDTETTGLFPHDGSLRINAISLGLPHRTWVIPGHMPKSPWRHGEVLAVLMEHVFDLAEGKRTYAQNCKYDDHVMWYAFGRQFRPSFDTMLASHTLDENQDHDLKSMVRRELDEPEYDISVQDKQGISERVRHKPTLMYLYAGKDANYTLRIGEIYEKRLKQNFQLRRLFYKLVMPAARTLEKIERRGLWVNLDKFAKIDRQLLEEKNRLQQKLNKIAGRVVNWNAPAQVGKFLYKDLGLKCTVLTKTGAPSTSEEAVIDLLGEHPAVAMILKFREVMKFRSTYVNGFRTKYLVGNRLFIPYKQHGTVTGRYSSPIHSIPRDGSIRNLVEAPDGWEFCQIDISQAELRIVADESGDPELRKCFTEDIDAHWRTLMHTIASGGMDDYYIHAKETAAKVLGKEDWVGKLALGDVVDLLLEVGHEAAIEIWKGWKEGRKKAKAINFGFIYGMYEKKFMHTARMKYGWAATWDEAHSAREAYFHLYGGIARWHDRVKKLAKLNGHVRNKAGRLRRLPAINGSDKKLRAEAERQAVNSPIQGFIGDYKAMAMVEIEETISPDQFQLLGEHHDALLGIVRKGEQESVFPQIHRTMCHPRLLDGFNISLSVPMAAEIEVGPWGAGKKWTTDAKAE